MAWPFTPITTFLAKSVPKVTAAFLNSLQTIHNATFAPVYHRRPSIYVESTNGTQVAVYAASLTVKDSVTGEYVYIDQVGRTVSTTWPANAWRYLYLVSASGVASVEISSTAPATPIASPLFKTGDETRRYLCAVRCNGSNAVVGFNMIDGRYLYLGENIILSSTAGTGAYQTVSMATFVPPHVRRVHLVALATNSSGSPDAIDFRTFSASGIPATFDANSFDERAVSMATASDAIDWLAAATLTIDVLSVRGWEE
jgi:hypothetical protein